MKYYRLILTITSLFLFGIASNAVVADTLSLNVYFRQGSPVIDREFRNNGKNLTDFIREVNSILADSTSVIHSVCVETGASPEGNSRNNEKLAIDRARSVRKYLIDNLPLSPSQVKAYALGVDWEGLVRSVRRNPNPWEKEILDVLSTYSVRTSYDLDAWDKCVSALKSIDNGKAWRWLNDNVFAQLRGGSGRIWCVFTTERPKPLRDTLVIIHEYQGPDAQAVATAALAASQAEQLKARNSVRGFKTDSLFRKPVFAFRSNLLFPVMNIGIEVPIGNRVSIGLDWYYPWIWREWLNKFYPANKYCIEALGAYVDVRYWFGRMHRKGEEYAKYRLCGHSLGIVATGGYLDYAWNNHDLTDPVTGKNTPWTGRQGEYWGVGLSYMYSLPLGRNGWGRMEFEIAAGYYSTVYRPYKVFMEGGKLFADGYQVHKQGFYPLKAGINLVVPIFVKEKRSK